MGKYDGIIKEYDDKGSINFSLTDCHYVENLLYVNKNFELILNRSQYNSDQFTITNDVLNIDKDEITINPKINSENKSINWSAKRYNNG